MLNIKNTLKENNALLLIKKMKKITQIASYFIYKIKNFLELLDF